MILGPLSFLCYACFMGRHSKYQSMPYQPPTKPVDNRLFEPREETLSIPMQPKVQEPVEIEAVAAQTEATPKQRVWVVQEERRVALGALVTVAKGKVIKKADVAEKLRKQGVNLEEKYI